MSKTNKSATRRPSAAREWERQRKRRQDRIRLMSILVGGSLAGLLAIAALAQAISGDADTSPAARTNTPTSATITREVDVKLTEYAVTSTLTTFTTGVQYHFVIRNQGQAAHEFVLGQPMASDTSMDQIDKAALYHIPEDQLKPGATQTFDFVFDQPSATGQLELACHVGNHYALGMRLPITVKKG
ncbi:MAG: hypothetical protein IVW57_10045 [Ktedonobacterales bacterium]|nr:hypothetical protein [Ktedonobacterales bacterium]